MQYALRSSQKVMRSAYCVKLRVVSYCAAVPVLLPLVNAVVFGVRRTFHSSSANPVTTSVNAPSEPVSRAVS